MRKLIKIKIYEKTDKLFINLTYFLMNEAFGKITRIIPNCTQKISLSKHSNTPNGQYNKKIKKETPFGILKRKENFPKNLVENHLKII